MKEKDKIVLYKSLLDFQDKLIKQLRKELSIYRDKYNNLRKRYYYENRKNNH